MRIPLLAVVSIPALLLIACSKAPETPPGAAGARTESVAAAAPAGGPSAAQHAEHAIAWESGDVDAAFVKAKAENKPLFLYWGAVWCPPCNEVKATIFTRQDFIERSRNFVPVYIDGDAKGAQKLGARFNVSGYPTMVLFTPDGNEITRLPGEVEPDRYMQVLALGMNGARPVKETLASALAAPEAHAKLRPEDWRMLAWYSWETDESQVLPASKRPATLARLAKACPADEPQLATRLALQAMIATAKVKGAAPRDDRAGVDFLLPLLADRAFARENFDLIVFYADDVAGNITLPKSTERARLVEAWNAALDRVAADPELSELDRLAALNAEVVLAKLDSPKGPVPDALQKRLRDEAARADRETKDPYSRQSVISAAAETLAEAGLFADSDALLTAELARSHSPYYFMLGLADNAKKRGDKTAAVDWAEKAYDTAKGPATRLQWGSKYISLLVELTPQDAARIEKAAASVIGELEPSADTFYERNQRALQRVGTNLAKWNKDNGHADAVRRLRADMAGVCAKVSPGDPARATCDSVLKAGASRKA
jgi:thiol-disulfide isomerase/thioredoxin